VSVEGREKVADPAIELVVGSQPNAAALIVFGRLKA
jgi:hypothetical protein